MLEEEVQERGASDEQRRHDQDDFAMEGKFLSAHQRRSDHVLQHDEAQASENDQGHHGQVDECARHVALQVVGEQREARIAERRDRMEHGHEPCALGHAPAECLVQDHGPDELDGQRHDEDVAHDPPGFHLYRLEVVGTDHPPAGERNPAPKADQVDRGEGNDAQATGLDEEEDHHLAEAAVRGCVHGDQPGDAHRGGRGEDRVDERKSAGPGPGDGKVQHHRAD